MTFMPGKQPLARFRCPYALTASCTAVGYAGVQFIAENGGGLGVRLERSRKYE